MSLKNQARLSGGPRLETSNGKTYWVQAYYTKSGKRKRTTAQSSREAVKLAKVAVASEFQEEAVARGYTTFKQFAAKFIEDSRQGRDGEQPLEPSTIAGYEAYLRNWVLPQLGAILLRDIDVAKVRAFRDYLIARCPSRNTAKHALSLAKAILKYASLTNAIEFNPADGIKIKLDWSTQEDLKSSRIHSEDEMTEIDQIARNLYTSDNLRIANTYKRYYPMFLLLRTTGMRISECLALQWSDFGIEYSKVSILRKVDRVRGGQNPSERVGRAKSKNSRRTIPVPPSVRPTLSKWRLSCPASKEGWVFPTNAGHPLDYNNVKNKFWKPLLKRVNERRKTQNLPPIEDHGMHGLRHYFVSLLVREGRIKEASMLAGHSSVAFTLDRYGHMIPNDQKTLDELSEIVSRNLQV
jgi:integrase